MIFMKVWKKLEDVDLPDKIYNGPLETKIVPLVRAVSSHLLTTSGSCEGHLWHGTNYPWVKFFGYEDSKLLAYLTEQYSKVRDVKWTLSGGTLRTLKNARNQEELELLQRDIPSISGFLFDHRPEVL